MNPPGSITRGAIQRLFQPYGDFQYSMKPVLGATIESLDVRRLRDYFTRILGRNAPDFEDRSSWINLLHNIGLYREERGQDVSTTSGLLLFGKLPHQFLSQSGIHALCYPGTKLVYATRADEDLRGAILPLCAANGSLVEIGLVESAWDFMRRNTMPSAYIDRGRRIDRWEFPKDVVCEIVVNALVHRDYSITGDRVILEIYADRLEITSPGSSLITANGMKSGMRRARNQILVDIMRDYGYIDKYGMGIRNKIIPAMKKHNNTQPELIAEKRSFTVRLWKNPST